MKQETMGGSDISWTICKSSAPHYRQITMPVPQHSPFTVLLPFLPPNQQHRSIESTSFIFSNREISHTDTKNYQLYILYSVLVRAWHLPLTIESWQAKITPSHQEPNFVYNNWWSYNRRDTVLL